MKPSMVYAPSALPMINDEQWNRHIAGGWNNGGDTAWIVCDPVFDVLDEAGQYHGAKVAAKYTFDPVWNNPPIQSGSLAFYDGHVGIRRDPAPSNTTNGRSPLLILLEFAPMLDELLYAQRGLDLMFLTQH